MSGKTRDAAGATRADLAWNPPSALTHRLTSRTLILPTGLIDSAVRPLVFCFPQVCVGDGGPVTVCSPFRAFPTSYCSDRFPLFQLPQYSLKHHLVASAHMYPAYRLSFSRAGGGG
jgi:hypothetical protein